MRNQNQSRNYDHRQSGQRRHGSSGSNRDREGRFSGSSGNDNWRNQERDDEGRFAGYGDSGGDYGSGYGGSGAGRGGYANDVDAYGDYGRGGISRGGYGGNEDYGTGMSRGQTSYEQGGSDFRGGGNNQPENQGRQSHPDPDYDHWRNEQISKLDEDYDSWQSERRKKFADEFGKWRTERASASGTQQSGGESKKQS